MNTKKEEIFLIDIQIFASIIFIFTIIINIYLSINARKKIIYNLDFINKDKRKQIQISNRIIVIFLLVIYLYAAYKQSIIDKIKGKDLRADNIEILVSTLSLIGGLLILYEIYKYSDNEDNIENPTV